MEYFLSIVGERSGPFSQFQIIERIRESALQGTELVWSKENPDWQPLKGVREFEGYWPITEEQIAQADEARRLARLALDTPQPWLRFWARMVDYLWFGFVVGLALNIFVTNPETIMHPSAAGQLLGCLLMITFVPVEAWCLSRFGTTPGKSLMRIQIQRQEGGLPSFKQAILRSLMVHVRGVALGLTIPAIFTMSLSRLRLLRTGATSWDRLCQTRVEHGEPELWRFLLVAGLFATTLVLLTISLMLLKGEMLDSLRSGLPK